MTTTNFPNGLSSYGIPVLGGTIPANRGKYYFVDGTNGSDGNRGLSRERAFATIGKAVAMADNFDTILVFPKENVATDTDPGSYAETNIITVPQLTIMGVGSRTQGGLPQVKIGSGSTAMFTVRAPGFRLLNMGINGASATAHGITLDDNGGSTKSAFGAVFAGCHFKNCAGTTGKAHGGGAITWTSAGGAWQVLISNNLFYKCVAGVAVLGTTGSVPQDVVIEDNVFSSAAATDVDCDIYTGGSGVTGLVVKNNTFATVDVPQLGSADEGLYVSLTGSKGVFCGNRFSCVGKTFGADGNAAKIPTTMRIAANYQEVAAGAGATGQIGRT